MINKIIIMVASSSTIAGISYGIYTARKVATTTPICYWDMEQGYSGVNYGDTYLLLLIGFGVGATLIVLFNSLIEEGE